MSTLYIAGAGASGLMAAITAARAGADPVLIEGIAPPAKKILATGNGHCNYSNQRMKKDRFHSSWADGPMKVIRAFDEKALTAFFEELGLLSTERDGYMYPANMQAKAVRDILLREVTRLKIRRMPGEKLSGVSVKNGLLLSLESGKKISADRLILCTGGKAAPKTGSDGSGLAIAEKLGHTVIPLVPALTGLLSEDRICSIWQGVRVKAKVSACDINGRLHSDTGEVQLTKNGISGIPVFQISRHVNYVLLHGKKTPVVIDFFPEGDDSRIVKILKRPDITVYEALNGFLPDRLADALLKRLRISSEEIAGRTDPERILKEIHFFSLVITASRGFEEAQTTASGVDLRQINTDTMESRLVKGLYFAGEILDVDGLCGGYNLQWAFSSGYLAGLSAARN